MMIVSIGLSIFLRNIYEYFAGAQVRNYSQYGAVEASEIGQILLTPKELVVILVGITVLVVATSLLQFTRLGKATRAVSDNPGTCRCRRHQRRAGDQHRVDRRRRALAGLAGALLGVTRASTSSSASGSSCSRSPQSSSAGWAPSGCHPRRVRDRHLHRALDLVHGSPSSSSSARCSCSSSSC